MADLNAWVRELEAGRDPARARAEIEAVPNGQVYLLHLWRAIGAGVEAEDPEAENRAVAWLGVDDITPSELLARVAAEVARLEALVAANGPLLDEAAAERGTYRAVRGIAESRHAQGLEPIGATIAPPAPAFVPPPSEPATPPAPPTPPADDWLGSFGAGGEVDPALTLAGLLEPPAVPIPARKPRRDLRKLARKGR